MRSKHRYPDDSPLRKALRANALFSGLSALALLVAAGPLGRALGTVPDIVLYVIGAGLALFSIDLFLQARAGGLDPRRAFAATLADLAWVIGSAVLLVLRPAALSEAGLLLVGGVALVVLALAVSQLAGLRRFAANRRGATDERSMFVLSRRLDAPAERVWSLIRELDRIDEFYPELSSVEVVEDREGVPAVRTCTDRDGRRWSEEVVSLDDEERELTLRFVSEAEDFPFPVSGMTGGWHVEPRDGGSELTLWYELTVKGGMLGEIVAALLAPSLRKRMTPVIENLAARAAEETASPSAEISA